jgi:small conductance mechanosensitive channel
VLAATSVAIGIAWSGLLSNFAAGIFMIVLRPVRKGDAVQIAGVVGDVHEIGLFATTVIQADGTKSVIGNTRAFSETIHNFSAAPHRRPDVRVPLPYGYDPAAFHAAVRARLDQEPQVLKTPAPVVETVEHTIHGPVTAIRPFCAPTDYGEVLFLTNRIAAEEIRRLGVQAPPR